MNVLKMIEDFKKRELEEIKKDGKKGFPIRINPKSYFAKELSYQTVLLKRIIENQNVIISKQKAQSNKRGNDETKDIADKARAICDDVLKSSCREEALAILEIAETLVKTIQF